MKTPSRAEIKDLEEPAAPQAVRINRWLPYYAVYQMDLWQTVHSWIFRAWVLISLLATGGYLLYKAGVQREAGITVSAANIISDVLRWTVFGSVTLIVILTAGSISGERGTLADSVLSRGISRYQYFLGKWHARLSVVLGTFIVLGFLGMTGSKLLHEDLSLIGALIALTMVSALLMVVVTCGVTVSAFVNSTLLAIAMLWFVLYGLGFIMALLPLSIPTPDRLLNSLPNILRGEYDLAMTGKVVSWAFLGSLFVAMTGMVYFSRRDV